VEGGKGGLLDHVFLLVIGGGGRHGSVGGFVG